MLKVPMAFDAVSVISRTKTGSIAPSSQWFSDYFLHLTNQFFHLDDVTTFRVESNRKKNPETKSLKIFCRPRATPTSKAADAPNRTETLMPVMFIPRIKERT
jgi:hypothetical protein